MFLGKISFCDKQAFNIKSDDEKSRILDELNAFDVRVIKKHHEVFQEHRHVTIINNNPFLISVRTNGNPYYMFLTRINFINQCIFIDKKVQQGYFFPRMIISRFLFDDALYENTLFEGEMVKDTKGDWTFIINDVLVLEDKPLHALNIVQRANLIHDIMENKFALDDLDVCRIEIKNYFDCSQLGWLLDVYVNDLPYSSRGVYFKPFFMKYRDILLNFDDRLIKRMSKKRYKDMGNFFLSLDEMHNNCGVEEKKENDENGKIMVGEEKSRGNPDHIVVDGERRQQEEKERDSKECLFWVKNTNMFDVYELYPQLGDAARGEALIAAVPTLSLSRYLQEVFSHTSITDFVQMRCQFCDRFQKWMPIEKA
jgi:hypothetical protein